MIKRDLLRQKLEEHGIEGFAQFIDRLVLFANDPKFEVLPETVKAEILELVDDQLEPVDSPPCQ